MRLVLLFLALSSTSALSARLAPASFGESPLDTLPAGAAVELAGESRLEVVTELAPSAAAPALGQMSPATPTPKPQSDMSSLFYEKDIAGAPILHFDQRQIAFDTVARGEKREHTYKFKNVGSVPATIAIASACTCTTLDWTRGEIAPGGEGEIHAVFDSSEKSAGELIVIDVILEESAPSGNGIVEQVAYTFEIAGEK